MTTRLSNDGSLDATTSRPSNDGPLTTQRKSNDLIMTNGARPSNDAPLNYTAARITDEGTMTTS